MTSVERGQGKIMSYRSKNLGFAAFAVLLFGAGANAQQASPDTTHPVAIQRDETFKAGSADAPATDAKAPDGGTADSSVAAPASTDESGLPSAPEAKPADPARMPMPKTIYVYQRPTEKTKLVNYLFDGFGPFPLVGSALIAGINQADNNPPEWEQGLKGFGRRWGSNYGIGAITTTTRYGLAEVLHEDTLYYRCDCSGVFPRLRHALFSTLTGRRGEDGHRVFSIPSLVAPYVGTTVAVQAWYPARFSEKDAFRQGNYALLAYAAGNVVLEFFPSGPRSILSKFHLQNHHGAPPDSTTP